MLGRSLAGDDDVELLLAEPAGIALARRRRRGSRDRARGRVSRATRQSSRSCCSPPRRFGSRCELGGREGVPAAPALPRARRRRRSRSRVGRPPRRAAARRRRAFSRSRSPPSSRSRRSRSCGRRTSAQGGIALAFFVFPFVAGFGVVARTPARGLAPPRARVHARRARCAVRRDRALAGADAHALLRPRPRGRERVHDVLPGDVALQGPEPVRPLSRRPDRRPPRRSCCSGRGRASTGSSSPRSSRSSSPASTSRTRSRASSRSSSSRSPSRSLGAGRRLRIVLVACAVAAALAAAGIRGRGRRGQVGEGGHERALAPRRDHARRLHGQPGRRRRHRRSAARERGGDRRRHVEAKRLAHDAADRAGRARVVGFAALRLAARRGGLGARPRHPAGSPPRARPRRRAPRAVRALAPLRGVLRGPAHVGRPRARRSRALVARPSACAPRSRSRAEPPRCWHTERGRAPAVVLCQGSSLDHRRRRRAPARPGRARSGHLARDPRRPEGALDTDLSGVTVSTRRTTSTPKPSRARGRRATSRAGRRSAATRSDRSPGRTSTSACRRASTSGRAG